MGLPGHRRTSSDKRRRAAHFALVKPNVSADKKTGLLHRSHVVAPGATEYNGHAIHIKGRDRKMKKMLEKTKAHTETHDHEHDHSHEKSGS